MSTNKQPLTDLYSVQPNRCTCHPETCCCDPWAVQDRHAKKHSTHYEKATAQLVADALNGKNLRQQDGLQAA